MMSLSKYFQTFTRSSSEPRSQKNIFFSRKLWEEERYPIVVLIVEPSRCRMIRTVLHAKNKTHTHACSGEKTDDKVRMMMMMMEMMAM